jgi:hypothetical protein
MKECKETRDEEIKALNEERKRGRVVLGIG